MIGALLERFRRRRRFPAPGLGRPRSPRASCRMRDTGPLWLLCKARVPSGGRETAFGSVHSITPRRVGMGACARNRRPRRVNCTAFGRFISSAHAPCMRLAGLRGRTRHQICSKFLLTRRCQVNAIRRRPCLTAGDPAIYGREFAAGASLVHGPSAGRETGCR